MQKYVSNKSAIENIEICFATLYLRHTRKVKGVPKKVSISRCCKCWSNELVSFGSFECYFSIKTQEVILSTDKVLRYQSFLRFNGDKTLHEHIVERFICN
jgi:hypothetical protein